MEGGGGTAPRKTSTSPNPHEESGNTYDPYQWKTGDKQKKKKSRWHTIGLGRSLERKDEAEEDEAPTVEKEEKEEPFMNLDTFYDPMTNASTGSKGGLLQYLRMVGQDKLKHSKGKLKGAQKDSEDVVMTTEKYANTVRLNCVVLLPRCA